MTTMESTTELTLDATWLERLQRDFASARVDDTLMCETMRRVFESHGYYMDPHTAVGWSAAEQLGYLHSKETSAALLATASPCKFEHSVTMALGEDGWNNYTKTDLFPERARALLEKTEVGPVIYEYPAGQSLEDVQVGWEQQARDLVAKLTIVNTT
mmetsp:Transcript_5476/g.12136  ORF Transcript_5476/g.12136 Transcript_5476/m.12136 type:complete len:157 (-) Transcript_5476:28-498(-)